MISKSFVLGLLTLTWPLLKVVFQFYTTGTAYSKSDPEFATSLAANIRLTLMSHLGDYLEATDFQIFPFPMTPLFGKLGGRKFAQLRGFGDPVAGKDTLVWVLKPEGAKKAVLYLHGGGYALPLLIGQLEGIIAVNYAIKPENRDSLALAILYYLPTAYGDTYPTQIFEAVEAYRELVSQGYEVVVLGDSAGANLALAVARFFAYPEEAKAHFSQYPKFAWNFSVVAAPRHLVLISPWILPYTAPEPTPGVDHSGDSSPKKADMGLWYIGKEKKEDVWPFVNFQKTNYADHWAKVPAFNGEGGCLLTYGERELLRKGQEEFCARNARHISVHMYPGGVHDAMFAAEARNLGNDEAIMAGAHRSKFTFGLVGKFLDEVCQEE